MANQKDLTKGKLDPTTFFYGFGAGIVLIASMFKFLGWDYSSELFIFGLSIEAIVFFISAFERTKDDKEYAWENVFPQLLGNSTTTGNSPNLTGPNANQIVPAEIKDDFHSLSSEIQTAHRSLESFSGNIGKNTHLLAQSMNSLESLNKEIELYNNHLKKLNQKLNDLSGR